MNHKITRYSNDTANCHYCGESDSLENLKLNKHRKSLNVVQCRGKYNESMKDEFKDHIQHLIKELKIYFKEANNEQNNRPAPALHDPDHA